MATDNPTVTRSGDGSVMHFNYQGLDNGDDGAAIEKPEFADKSVQVSGTFGVGGSVQIEGSNKDAPSVDADWFTLTDAHSNTMVYTSAGGDAITENTKHIRPHVTAGDGATDLHVDIICRRPTDMRQ